MKESNFQRWNQNPLLYHLTNPQLTLAERLGIEPSDHISMVYGLAIRCITILPPLRVIWWTVRELNPSKTACKAVDNPSYLTAH